jgi:hypothetical protein
MFKILSTKKYESLQKMAWKYSRLETWLQFSTITILTAPIRHYIDANIHFMLLDTRIQSYIHDKCSEQSAKDNQVLEVALEKALREKAALKDELAALKQELQETKDMFNAYYR